MVPIPAEEKKKITTQAAELPHYRNPGNQQSPQLIQASFALIPCDHERWCRTFLHWHPVVEKRITKQAAELHIFSLQVVPVPAKEKKKIATQAAQQPPY